MKRNRLSREGKGKEGVREIHDYTGNLPPRQARDRNKPL